MKEVLLTPFRSSRDLEGYYKDRIAVRPIRDRRNSVKIAVIDDQPFAPQTNLRAYWYDITPIGDIRTIDQVAGYDLILCDILGVGLSFNTTLQGASLIAEIKRVFPEKWVIAYTGATLNQAVTREAKSVADALIKKDIDIKEWVDRLDRYVAEVLNPYSVWERIRIDLVGRGIGTKDVLLLESAYVGAIFKGRGGAAAMQKALDKSHIPEDARNIVNGVISSAIFGFIAGS